jgi:hypothetical protein
MIFAEQIFAKLTNGLNCVQEETAREHFAMEYIFDKPQARVITQKHCITTDTEHKHCTNRFIM